MKILLYNPDNGLTQNFMPHLWMFLLQSLTSPGHEVLLIDGNTRPMTDANPVRFAHAQGIGLVGIGAMTRMIAKAYRVADASRAAGIRVVMGGPHVTEVPDEALGRNGGPRPADAIALGEADETWPRIVADAAAGQLKEVYTPVDAFGQEWKPSLQEYPPIHWESLDLRQFNRIPAFVRPLMSHLGYPWETFHLIPIESGRGCPYGCEFCTVTGFFGDSIRFRTKHSIIDELLRLKARARSTKGQVAVFFVDDKHFWVILFWAPEASTKEVSPVDTIQEAAQYLPIGGAHARGTRVIQITAQMRVLVAIEPVDGRKGIDSLARLCQEKLAEDPFSGCVFVFRSRRGTAIRILTYDGQGYWLAQKRLSKGKFVWWPESDGASKPLEVYEAQLLMAAGDVSRVRAAPMWRRVNALR